MVGAAWQGMTAGMLGTVGGDLLQPLLLAGDTSLEQLCAAGSSNCSAKPGEFTTCNNERVCSSPVNCLAQALACIYKPVQAGTQVVEEYEARHMHVGVAAQGP